MQFVDISVEQSTAITDLLLGLWSLYLLYAVFKVGFKSDQVKTRLWVGIFGLLTIASLLGVIAHGLKLSPQLKNLVWQPLNLSLGLMVSCIAVSTLYEIKKTLPKGIIPLFIGIAVLFYFVTLIKSDTFLIFILYETLVMLYTLGGYIYLGLKQKQTGALGMAFGFLLTIIAAVVQASGPIKVHLIWDFDHNGLFHLIQILSMFFIWFGLRANLLHSGRRSN